MAYPFEQVVNLGVPAGMSPEEAKYIQMSNLGSLLLMAVNVPYLVLCAVYGWGLLVAEITALMLLLPLTVLANRLGRHVAATVYFGSLLNLHLVFVTVAVGRATLLPLLIFFTAGGVVTLAPRGRWRLIVGALALIFLGYLLAMSLERTLGPLYLLSYRQAVGLQSMVVCTMFALIVVNALIARLGANAAEDRLRLEHRRTEEFFQNVSHELRTPLTLILGPLEELLAGSAGPLGAAALERLGTVERNSRRLLGLINQLLDMSRVNAGARRLRTEPGNLPSVARAMVASFEPLAVERGISLSFTSSLADPWRDFDREIVEKVLANLLSNACKFTDNGGKVTVTLAERPEGGVLLAVADTGVGIAPQHLERVFDRFYQVDGSTTRPREGTGIGLSLVRELVAIHGGAVSVSSAPAQGSRFEVALPLASVAPVDRPQPAPGAAGGTILVVEDNPDMRRYIRDGLEPAWHVVEAADGEEGLRKARECLPRLVLCDVMMPRMDGLALCRALRSEERLALVPVVMLTAKGSPENVMQGLAAGAIAYVTKPFTLEVLRVRIRALLEHEAQVERAALRDGLTGLLTRAAWEQEAERELRRLRRSGGTASVAFLDLDDFKAVNDTHGHRSGDEVLVELARTVSAGLRASDVVGRYGGDELVALLPQSPAPAAKRSIERILEAFRARPIGARGLRCTFSAGVSELADGPADTLADCASRADAAMYVAKGRGKNRVEAAG